jgi:hypothetical protein
MARRKVLFFGITGIEKRATLDRLANWCEQARFRTCKVFNFEDDFLKPILPRTYFNFLDSDLVDQCDRWREAWNLFQRDLAAYEKEHPDADIFISLHGCSTRSHYGARPIIQPEKVAMLGADHIVTFLDNVYDMWWRTQYRAKGEEFRGTPTLQQLLQARHVETMVADQVALAGPLPRPRHLVLSVNHPIATVGNWLYGRDPKVVYLCFPISDPRTLLSQGDQTGRDEINGFLSEAYALQLRSLDRVLVCPLTIDELPLVKACGTVVKAGEPFNFDREALHWDLASVFPHGAACLSPGPLPRDQRCPIPSDDIRAAAGTIRTDVAQRDYRLVDQADYLAAFNPKFRPEFAISAGCKREIDHASQTRGIPVYIYQNEVHDPGNDVHRDFTPQIGSMGRTPGEMRIIWQQSLAEMLRTIER